ncbi:hypothetical protein ACHHYP_14906 [Achlya hypogyna]|uniref:Rho-GAP domain-containing protein n=1 Tax=Achlya hypogyna TaxID=1202772 RepID=A0A1V9YC42_ACHHY|nr:hypothetical protein ACHHYP_14906 [Achlya hypogyna]
MFKRKTAPPGAALSLTKSALPATNAPLPPLSAAHCGVLQAFVEHLAAHKAHKEKLFTHEGKASERKLLLRAVADGLAPGPKVLKKLSSRSISYVLRQMLEMEHAPLLPYAAYTGFARALYATDAAASNETLLRLIQRELSTMPLVHAALLHALLELMHKVSMQLLLAEESLITHVGVHLARPSEDAADLERTAEDRKLIARRLLAYYQTLTFPSATPMLTPTPEEDICEAPLPSPRPSAIGLRRRSSSGRLAWTQPAVVQVTQLLHHLTCSVGPKRDLFLSLPDAGRIAAVLAETDPAHYEAYTPPEIAAAVKHAVQALEALLPLESFQLLASVKSPTDAFVGAVRGLPEQERRIVALLLQVFGQAESAGASMDLLSAAMAHAIFYELKHTMAADGNLTKLRSENAGGVGCQHQRLEKAAIDVLTHAKQLAAQLANRPSVFTLGVVLWVIVKWHPAFNTVLCSRAPVLRKLFHAFCTSTAGATGRPAVVGPIDSPRRLDDPNLIDLMEAMQLVPAFATAASVIALRRAIQSQRGDPSSSSTGLPFEGFLELLLTLGMDLLSQPAFDDVYPSALDKVLVILDVWGFGSDTVVAALVA